MNFLRANQLTKSNFVNSRKGFTIVELLVAIGLFTTITSIAVGGFVRALRTQRQVAALISANDNVFLALEEMTREIRTGRLFCANDLTGSGTASSASCAVSSGIAFISGSTNETIEYRLANGYIEKGVSGTFTKITGSNALIQYLRFLYSGNFAGDGRQPRVTISLGVTSRTSGAAPSVTRLQTTVSPRGTDN